jgi:hypothetical protein
VTFDGGRAPAVWRRHRTSSSDTAAPDLRSLIFNVGPGAKGVKDGIITLKSGVPSTLLRLLNQSIYAGASDEFPKWCHGAGRANVRFSWVSRIRCTLPEMAAFRPRSACSIPARSGSTTLRLGQI